MKIQFQNKFTKRTTERVSGLVISFELGYREADRLLEILMATFGNQNVNHIKKHPKKVLEALREAIHEGKD